MSSDGQPLNFSHTKTIGSHTHSSIDFQIPNITIIDFFQLIYNLCPASLNLGTRMIVFDTASSELIAISYKYYVSALTFIEKSLEYSLLKKEINTCLKIYLEVIESSIID